MKLSDETIEELAKAIMASMHAHLFKDEYVIHRLMDFFIDVGEEEHIEAPSTMIPMEYAVETLHRYNGTSAIKNFIEKSLEPNTNSVIQVTNKTERAVILKRYLEADNYKLMVVKETIKPSYQSAFYYRVLDKKEFVKDAPEIEKNTIAKGIKEEAEKRFAEGNYNAAINECYNLAEAVIKNMIKAYGEIPKGGLKALYSQLSEILDLKPKGENIESYLKEVLQGLTGQVSGLYHLGNKAGTRHPAEFVAKRQDAKLAMNAAFTLCEYLQDAHKAHRVMPEEFAKLAKLTGAPGSKTY